MEKANVLLKYLPEYYTEIQEFIGITSGETKEIKLLFDLYKETLDIAFINKIESENQLQPWMEQFEVDLNHLSFAEKKRQLLALMLGFSKLSCSKIEIITLNKTGYRAESFIENSNIVINFNDIGNPDADGMEEVFDYINQLKPAHLGLEIRLLFRTHGQLKPNKNGFGGNTHNSLKTYTHEQIRTRKEAL